MPEKNDLEKQVLAARDEGDDTEALLDALEEVADKCYDTAEALGWHDKGPRPFGDITSLLHSEVSEAFEEYREGRAMELIYYRTKDGKETVYRYSEDGSPNKTEGIAAEWADIFIRMCDHGRELGIPWIKAVSEKMEYNSTRSYRHGGKVV